MDISIVIPLLNEEDSILELHDWIASVMQSNHFLYEVLFIDDGSTDQSWRIITSLSEKYPKKTNGIMIHSKKGTYIK